MKHFYRLKNYGNGSGFSFISEGLPGVLREEGNMTIYFKGTRDILGMNLTEQEIYQVNLEKKI